MSYSSDTKRELSRIPISSRIEALLELSALSRMNATVSMNRDGVRIRFFTESREVIDRIALLCEDLYGVQIAILQQKNDSLRRTPIYYGYLEGRAVELFMEQSAIDLFGNYTEDKNRIMGRLKSPKNGYAYLRGAFLGGGSIVDPKKSYHVEILVPNQMDAEILTETLDAFSIKNGVTVRKDTYVIYLKDSDSISDFLVLIGASQAMLKLEDAKAMKDLRNDINRKVNAETANMDKTIEAAFRQISAIEFLAKTRGLEALPEGLAEVCYARLRNPDANLRELGEQMEPPIGKSGMNHRLKKILTLAEEAGWEG